MTCSVNNALTTLDRLVDFARYLRTLGLPISIDRSINFCRASCCLDPLELGSLYWAGRATLVSDPDHLAPYNEAFRFYFMGIAASTSEIESESPDAQTTGTHNEQFADHTPSLMRSTIVERSDGTIGAAASEVDSLRSKSFEALTDEERNLVARSILQMKIYRPMRRTRRLKAGPAGHLIDARRTLRRALRTAGEPVGRSWRQHRTRRRSLVMILDISGSMAAYSRILAQFGYAAIRGGGRVEVFSFGTKLTRITPLLHHRDADVAMTRLTSHVRDWEGGTKIGSSLRALLSQFSQSATLRGSVVIICSDGLDRGDPALLEQQMARLRRLAHRIVWVNPLKGDPGYAPLARGMSTALPYIDDFVSGHNVASLSDLAAVLEGSSRRTRGLS